MNVYTYVQYVYGIMLVNISICLYKCRYLDNLPVKGNEHGQAFRDLDLERRVRSAKLDDVALYVKHDGYYPYFYTFSKCLSSSIYL